MYLAYMYKFIRLAHMITEAEKFHGGHLQSGDLERSEVSLAQEVESLRTREASVQPQFETKAQ